MKVRNVLCCLFAAAALLAAAGSADFFDPVKYTASVLDLAYKNDPENYRKIVKNTTDREAGDIYAHSVSSVMESFSGLDLTDEMNAKYRAVISDLMKNVRYTVSGAARQKGGGYIVSVAIEPVTIFQDTVPMLRKKSREYAVELSNSVMSGMPMPSEKEIQNHVYEIYYMLLNRQIEDGLRYGELQTVLIHIDKLKHRVYQIRPSDLDMLALKLLCPKAAV